MPKTPKEKIIESFENKFGLRGLQSKPLEYASITKDEYDRVKGFLSSSLDSYLAEVMKCLPEKMKCDHFFAGCSCEGFNSCRYQFLENLRKNGLIK